MMGLLDRLKGLRGSAAEPVYLYDRLAHGEHFDIVGESRRRDHLLACIRAASDEERAEGEVLTWAQVLPEPTNHFDPNAIQLLISGKPVGYVSKGETAWFGPALAVAGGAPLMVRARIGWNAESADPVIGVRLRLSVGHKGWQVLTWAEYSAAAAGS